MNDIGKKKSVPGTLFSDVPDADERTAKIFLLYRHTFLRAFSVKTGSRQRRRPLPACVLL
jgi:hypothetical protein